MFKTKRCGIIENRKNFDKSYVQSEADRSKEQKELMQTLGVTVPNERMIRAAAVKWYGHVLQR